MRGAWRAFSARPFETLCDTRIKYPYVNHMKRSGDSTCSFPTAPQACEMLPRGSAFQPWSEIRFYTSLTYLPLTPEAESPSTRLGDSRHLSLCAFAILFFQAPSGLPPTNWTEGAPAGKEMRMLQ